jgi:hypothetical protein
MVTRPDGSTVTVWLPEPAALTVIVAVWLAVPKGVKMGLPPLSVMLLAGVNVPLALVSRPAHAVPAHVPCKNR